MTHPETPRSPIASVLVRIGGLICCLAGIVLLAFSGACASILEPDVARQLGAVLLPIGLGGGLLLVLGSFTWILAGGRTATLLLILISVGTIVGLAMFVFMKGLANIKGPLN
jgi:ABC-type sugar transport system permease subunit